MKRAFVIPGLVLVLTGVRLTAASLTVHEWGTFTSVSGSDGVMLPGLEVEEERLPNFVHSFSESSATSKGLSHPVRNVTVKMETPVLYFYAAEPLTARVAVEFRGGSISQWYPDRLGGETLPASVDFATGYNGSAIWQVEVLAKGSSEKTTASPGDETAQWPRARVASANWVRGSKGEVERFIFYRGVGNFSLPLEVKAGPDGTLTVRNAGDQEIPFVWIYDNRGSVGGHYDWSGPLARGEARTLTVSKMEFGPERTQTLFTPLTEAGLTDDEARAMLATWNESYFNAPGLRVFWIVPRAFTDKILPLSITPAPDKIERVLVGRTEVLTTAFEAELVKDFKADGGQHWASGRYFLAYRERARQLGVVLPENSP